MDRGSIDSIGAAAPATAFDTIAVLGVIDEAVIPAGRLVDSADHTDSLGDTGPLDVAAAIAWATHHRPLGGRMLVLTDRDLHIPEVGSLFGFADRKHGIAIVSTFRLTAGDPPLETSRRRIQNAIAHEAGHLDGLRHCPNACVMRQSAYATDLDTRPDARCGRCPRRASMVIKIVLLLTALLVIVGITSRVVEHRVPQRVTPALPRVVADALAELPRDTDDVFSRPVTVVARATVTTGTPVLLTSAVLPPGIDAGLLTSFGHSITSAIFRTPDAVPIAYVHVVSTRGPATDLTAALGCPKPDDSAAYASCLIRHDDIHTHVVLPRQRDRIAIVFSPHDTGQEMASRLASAVGSGTGVWRDRDLNALIGTLPAVLPRGYTLDTLIASNVHRIPESVDELTNALLGEELAAGAAELKRVMPLAIEAAIYRNEQGHELTAVIGDYGNTATAWLTYRSIRGIFQPWITGVTTVGRHEAIELASATRQGLLFRRGQLVAAVHGPNSDTGSLIREMANALQP